jgi:hypothetical protein
VAVAVVGSPIAGLRVLVALVVVVVVLGLGLLKLEQ